MKNESKIHRVAGTVMAVNAHIVESADGVVVVDGMLTVTDARAVRRAVDALGKPVLGAIVTHAHPDHYAGLGELLRGLDVPIVATAHVRAAITRDDATKAAIVGPMMGAEWPETRVFPTHDVPADGVVRLGELVFRVQDVGPAESPADSVWTLDERTLFVGDLVYSGMHAYLADGHASEWLACLDRLERELAQGATLHVGHGPAGGVALFGAQKRYITAFVESVERHLGRPPEERRARVVLDMKSVLRTDDLLFLMELSVDPFAGTLSGAR